MSSKTVQAAQRLLADRERVGLAKYGSTVDRSDLQAADWLQHAIEEASDLLLYLIRLQQAASDLMPRFTSPFTSDGNCDPDADLLGNQFSDIRAAHDRAAYLARWANAPVWAQWLAEDDDGAACWFDRQPCNHIVFGWTIDEGRTATATHRILGRVACEPRPEVQS